MMSEFHSPRSSETEKLPPKDREKLTIFDKVVDNSVAMAKATSEIAKLLSATAPSDKELDLESKKEIRQSVDEITKKYQLDDNVCDAVSHRLLEIFDYNERIWRLFQLTKTKDRQDSENRKRKFYQMIIGTTPSGKVDTSFMPGFVQFVYHNPADYWAVACHKKKSAGEAYVTFRFPYTIVNGTNLRGTVKHETQHIANHIIFEPRLLGATEALENRPRANSPEPPIEETASSILWGAYRERYKDEIIAYIGGGDRSPDEIKHTLLDSPVYDYHQSDTDFPLLKALLWSKNQPTYSSDEITEKTEKGFQLVKKKVTELIDTAFAIQGLLGNKIKSKDLVWLLAILPVDRWATYLKVLRRCKTRKIKRWEESKKLAEEAYIEDTLPDPGDPMFYFIKYDGWQEELENRSRFSLD